MRCHDKEFVQFLLRAIRRYFGRTPQYARCREAVKSITYEGRRKRVWYTCASCGEKVSRKNSHVDHIDPVVPVEGFDNWDALIERLFFGNFQVLCVPCHKAKSKLENRERRVKKKAK